LAARRQGGGQKKIPYYFHRLQLMSAFYRNGTPWRGLCPGNAKRGARMNADELSMAIRASHPET
jgi:hypothetical protein